MLTKQQKKLLLFIEGFQKEKGISPSFDEMRCAMEQKSKSSIHTLLSGLVERGFVRKLNNRARALEIIKHPDLSLNTPAFLVAESKPSPKKDQSNDDDIITVPFFGAQTTVFPLKLFLSNPHQILRIPKSFLGAASHMVSAIQIKGDSLKELGILDNDMVFFDETHTSKAGEVVLAVTSDDMIHVRRWEEREGKVLLSTNSKYMMPEVFEKDQIKIIGTMIGLSRKA